MYNQWPKRKRKVFFGIKTVYKKDTKRIEVERPKISDRWANSFTNIRSYYADMTTYKYGFGYRQDDTPAYCSIKCRHSDHTCLHEVAIDKKISHEKILFNEPLLTNEHLRFLIEYALFVGAIVTVYGTEYETSHTSPGATIYNTDYPDSNDDYYRPTTTTGKTRQSFSVVSKLYGDRIVYFCGNFGFDKFRKAEKIPDEDVHGPFNSIDKLLQYFLNRFLRDN